ncbi:phosphoadenosine phosphosulfate reductase family protein [Cytobacillus firmus]|uniref:Phosphoadenosine phosphosulphate reductase domain-containing protein n=1 Tax=Cytobacillus firmus DS1 TaxID=1307436 RepID=W7L0Q6_CYTFI|nr:phosphoadenosine phosphosulfate reductase family protein [Cytobacillus firmus]EWG08607.1 hypothetical protein PBF_23478 [Cytobacillus firmus DS1]
MSKTYDDVLMDWMFYREEKLQLITDIRDHMRTVYLSDNKPMILAVSFGKDSSLVLTLFLEMLNSLTPAERQKKVYVISADTLVETESMSSYVRKNLEAVGRIGKELGIEILLSAPNPKEKFFFNVIGKGLPAPNGKSRFRWCSGKLKLSPMNRTIEYILKQSPVDFDIVDFDATLLIGTRLDESVARANSIRKFEVSDYFSKHHTYEKLRVYTPIKTITTFDLWIYLENFVQVFPWGELVSELRAMYEDGKECPIVRSVNDKACGSNSSRNGCWVCLMSGRRDGMLEALIEKGHKDAPYLAEWKAFLFDVANDVRYREPLRRKEYRSHLSGVDQGEYTPITIFEELDPSSHYYHTFQRAKKGNENGEFRPGGFTITLRKILLEKLLYTQEKVGYTLIEEEEITSILEAWNEDGFEFSRIELQPVNHQYDGSIVFHPDWTLNTKETTNPNPIFYVEYKFKFGFDDMIAYIKERQQFMKDQIFCYFDHDDLVDDGLVWNKAVFVVAREDIRTQKEADEYVAHWLFIDGLEAIGTDGKPFNKMVGKAKDAAIHHLLLDTLYEGIKMKKEMAS